ncbi:MAG TPA: AAA family ATPase [Armatimonadota bacterium]|nr:AAA family ATPase [Armatimonadota bacterium]
MRLRSLTLSGFTNFREPVAFGPLDDLNVVYGPSNAGKSNLLRAIELYLRLLGAGEGVSKSQPQILDNPERETAALLEGLTEKPLTFSAEWQISEKALQENNLTPEQPFSRLVTLLELRPANRSFELRVQKWIVGDQDFAAVEKEQDPRGVQFAQQLRRLVADARPFLFEKPVLPQAWLGQAPELFPQRLRDLLFDARQSTNQEQRRRWMLFSRLAASFQEELGEGSWETTFDRSTGAADLVYLRGEEVLKLERMGAGIQRLAALLAELCLAQERIVCAEEPECRLSPELQRRFCAMAARVIEAGVGPRQLFVSTHSPLIAAAGSAFRLSLEAGGPLLERTPWDAAGAPAGAAEPGLGKLIGLVEELATLDPDQLAGSAAGVAG